MPVEQGALGSGTGVRERGRMKPAGVHVRTDDGVELALHRVSGAVWQGCPVLLTHGTFSNGQVCAGLAGFLADHGFDCWVLELRGHGQSERGHVNADFERFAMFDVPAGFQAVLRATGKEQVFLVAHSGGGLVFVMYLARNPEARERVRGLVTLASQATEAGATLRGRANATRIMLINNLAGPARRRLLGFGPEDEFRGVVNQWFRWNWRRRWLGNDGFDYLEAAKGITVPTLWFAGAADRYIAPVRGCRRIYEALGSSDKEFVECGKASGFSEDYDHTRIIASRPARHEIWPWILRWLLQRD